MSDEGTTERSARGYDEAARALLAVLHRIERLKHLPRSGWVDRDVAAPETVAAHSWRLAVLAMLAAQVSGLDPWKAVRIALVHDLAEAMTGDSTPFDDLAVSATDRRALAANPPEISTWRDPERRRRKVRVERAALDSMLTDLPPAIAAMLREAWEEYEEGRSEEAALVRQLDKVEAYVQGLEYAQSGRLADADTLRSFQIDTEAVGRAPLVVALLGALASLSTTPESEVPAPHTAADSGS